MKIKSRKSIAILLVFVFMATLVPLSMLLPLAEEITTETPVLNKTIVGTVKFQSFNFLGDNGEDGKDGTQEDATDYQATFYYSDDYFSQSAVNANLEKVASDSDAIQKAYNDKHRVPWTYLDNPSLATCSMDLAVAAYSTGKGDVDKATSRTWANTKYENRDEYAIDFLKTCGFDDIYTEGYKSAPKRDSIAFSIGSKTITVWDATAQKNRDYTLVAVGVRGAGYGSEWASNVEIGTPGDGENNSRHEGFNSSAKKVIKGIETYIDNNNISGDVKYWVAGFSRAAAVANLTAGYLTADAKDFGTSIDDVYGYTYEAPQGASTADDNALAYPNIHNIINAMDVVPMVSPSVFGHQRLGVDYVMPYYGNTTTEENTAYYYRMYDVLKTIATGDAYSDKVDPLIDAVDPNNYPYNRNVPIYTITAKQLIADALDENKDTLMKNFGTVLVSGTEDQKIKDMKMDKFLESVLDVCLSSTAWNRRQDNHQNTTDFMKHKTYYINTYQEQFQNAFDYFLDFSGPAYMDMIDVVVENIKPQLKLTNASLGFAFLGFYNKPSGKYKVTDVVSGLFDGGSSWWLGEWSWFGKERKQILIDKAKPVVKEIVSDMTSTYASDSKKNSSVTLEQMETAIDYMVEVVIDLYADELEKYNSNYFGTTLHYLDEILSTHEQETVMSWIMSLDDNHINRGYRTLTLPANTDIKLYEFRENIEGAATFDGTAPIVAEFKNGDEVSSLDQRIYHDTNGDVITIRYPASLDIRADITTKDDKTTVDKFSVKAEDYMTKSYRVGDEKADRDAATNGIDQAIEQYQQLSNKDMYQEITNDTSKTNASTKVNNQTADELPLVPGETYQIIANGTSTYDNSGENDNNVYDMRKTVRVTWQNDDGSVLKTENVAVGTKAEFGDTDPVSAKTAPAKQEYVFTGWTPEVADSVTTPTTYTATYDLQEKLLTAHTLTLEGNIGSNFYYYIPNRYSGDLQIQFIYKNKTVDGELVPSTIAGYNYKASFTVAAKEMSEDVYAILYCDGKVIDEHSYPVMKYARIVLNNQDKFSDALINLSYAMLYYGGCSQINFGYNTDNLANDGIDYVSPKIEPDTLPIAEFSSASLDPQIEKYGLQYSASSLILESETTLRLYFTPNENYSGDVSVKVNGKEKNFGKKGSDIYIDITNIAAKNIGDIFTITIGDVTFQYSVLNYINNALKVGNPNLINTVTALYDYYQMSKAYFANKK